MSSTRRAIVAALLIGISATQLSAEDLPQDAAWRYVVPAPGEPMEHPPLVPLALGPKRPDFIEKEPQYRGQRRWYGLLRFGSDTSPQVVIVVDERAGGEFDLYVNAARGPYVTPAQVVSGEGRLRRAALTCEISHLDQAPEEYPRHVLFRRGVLPGSIGAATLGYLEGTVEMGGRKVAARRVDADANGLFSDPRDRLWLDLDGDGHWDPFSEQFPLQPVLAFEGKRYAVRTDQAGTRLALEEITGVGTLTLKLGGLAPGTVARSVEAALMGEDGSAYAAHSDGEALILPVGKYAVRSLRLSLVDPQSSKPWNFQFSRYEPPRNDQWHAVAAGQQVTLDPCGPLKLTIEGQDLKQPARPGREITVNPRLYTAEGLLINSCDFHDGPAELGDATNQNRAQVTLRQTDGTSVGEHTSGFA